MAAKFSSSDSSDSGNPPPVSKGKKQKFKKKPFIPIGASSSSTDVDDDEDENYQTAKQPLPAPPTPQLIESDEDMPPAAKKKKGATLFHFYKGTTAGTKLPARASSSATGSSSNSAAAANDTQKNNSAAAGNDTQKNNSTPAAPAKVYYNTVKLKTFKTYPFHADFMIKTSPDGSRVVHAKCLPCSRHWDEIDAILENPVRRAKLFKLSVKGHIDRTQISAYAVDGVNHIHRGNLSKHVDGHVHQWAKSKDTGSVDVQNDSSFLLDIASPPPHSSSPVPSLSSGLGSPPAGFFGGSVERRRWVNFISIIFKFFNIIYYSSYLFLPTYFIQ